MRAREIMYVGERGECVARVCLYASVHVCVCKCIFKFYELGFYELLAIFISVNIIL